MRYKTEHSGVFYRVLQDNNRKEKSYYVLYKRNGKTSEEQVGRQYADNMTPLKAAGIREDRIRELLLTSLKKKRKAKDAKARKRRMPAHLGHPNAAKGKTSLLKKHVVGLEQEISEKIPIEKDFHNPMEVTRLMLNYSNDAIYISQDGITKFVNAKIEKMTGFPSSELINTWSFNLTHPDDIDVILDRYKKRSHGEEVPNLYPHRIFDKWGNVKWIEVSAVIVSWEGRPAVLNFVRDITEKKAAEDALMQSEQLRTDIINFLPDATFAISTQGCVTAWNRAIEELTGVTAQEMIGKDDHEYALVFYGERKPMLIDKALQPSLPITERHPSFDKENNCWLAETELTHNGKMITLWCKAGLMKDSRGETIGAIESLRDISSLKEMNTALDALLKKREKDIQDSEEKIMRNINELVLPYVLRLKSVTQEHSRAVNIDIIEKHLQEIMSPFLSRLSSRYVQFSPREMEVASLIKNGMTTKEIARLLSISSNAIDIYRLKIRKKLGLNKEKINLSSFLNTLSRL